MTKTIRIGAVSYLNSKPLVYRLDELAPHAEIVYDLPSRLASQLANRQLDVALIPSVEFLRSPHYEIVSDACVACGGRVLSVKLYCRAPPEQIRTLALDEGSRSSAALAQVLLLEQYGVRPRLETLPIGNGLSDTDADAVLLIGDRAIRSHDGQFAQVWDVGDVWCRWAKLPFVFAMWATLADTDLQDVGEALAAARDGGQQALPEIAAAEAPVVGLSEKQCLDYLRDNLYFCLGDRELSSLQLFCNLAAKLDLTPSEREIRFHDCQTT